MQAKARFSIDFSAKKGTRHTGWEAVGAKKAEKEGKEEMASEGEYQALECPREKLLFLPLRVPREIVVNVGEELVEQNSP